MMSSAAMRSSHSGVSYSDEVIQRRRHRLQTMIARAQSFRVSFSLVVFTETRLEYDEEIRMKKRESLAERWRAAACARGTVRIPAVI